jgi:hypothetical protein
MSVSAITVSREKISGSGRALAATQMFRLLFGGYLAAQDRFSYNDSGSALMVLGIYALLGLFTVLFLFGKRPGLHGIMGLSVILIAAHTAFIFISAGQGVDAGLHDPLNNLWSTVLRYVFFLLTLVWGIRVYREKPKS